MFLSVYPGDGNEDEGGKKGVANGNKSGRERRGLRGLVSLISNPKADGMATEFGATLLRAEQCLSDVNHAWSTETRSMAWTAVIYSCYPHVFLHSNAFNGNPFNGKQSRSVRFPPRVKTKR